MRRRELILGGLSLPLATIAGSGLLSPLTALAADSGTAFNDESVPAMARELAAVPFRKPPADLPQWLQNMGYDEYRDIRFNPAHALWSKQGSPFQAQFFHRGFLFKDRVQVFTVAAGRARQVD